VGTVKSKSIREALQQVADYPQPLNDEVLLMPVHEIVARTLFDIANQGDPKVRGSMSRANRARKMILQRMGGRRRPGTKPISHQADGLDFIDLTGGVISAPAEDVQPADGGRPEPGITL
jgi:hypothetical protein